MATPLDERMRLHTPGQVTWPEPELNKTCGECAQFNTAPFKTAGVGRCLLVAGHQGVNGKGFNGGGDCLPKIQSAGC